MGRDRVDRTPTLGLVLFLGLFELFEYCVLIYHLYVQYLL